ncbi:MAG TPA: hypothetical protein PLX35_07415 [Cyclobacteriaceae bacterium]|nr:hypothetical protein [Cyclobacteriaceae bacterium]
MKTQLYFKFLELRQNTESNRWMRFNTLLVVNSLLIASWSQLITRPGLGLFVVEIILTLFGAGLSLTWSILSVTTNAYHKTYNKAAKSLEAALKAHSPELTGNFISQREKRIKVKGTWKELGTSTFLTESIPLFFALLFLILAAVSVTENWAELSVMLTSVI